MTEEEVRREKETRRNVKTREVKSCLPLYLIPLYLTPPPPPPHCSSSSLLLLLTAPPPPHRHCLRLMGTEWAL